MTDYVRSIHPIGAEAFDAVLADAEVRMNRQIIEGPSPEEEPDLRRRGWNPTAAHEVAQRRAQQEIDQAARFDAEPEWRRERIRDVIAARETFIELNEKLTRGLLARGVDHDRLFADGEAAQRAFDAMPSHDVAVTPNDIHDIDALGSTLPYCDIVVIDKAAATHATRTGVADRLGTTVLSRLTDLPRLLEAAISSQPNTEPRNDHRKSAGNCSAASLDDVERRMTAAVQDEVGGDKGS